MSAYLSSSDAIAALATFWANRPGATPREDLIRAIGCANIAAGNGWPSDGDAQAEALIKSAKGNHARACFELLLAENVASLQARYPECSDMWQPAAFYRFRPSQAVCLWIARRRTGRLVGILRGYRYQSCEHESWQSSIPFFLCSQISEALLRNFEDACTDNPLRASFDESEALLQEVTA